MTAWQQTGIPLHLINPQPGTNADLCRAHDPAYVRAVLTGRIPNGFGNTDPVVNATLVWTAGSMISAAEWAATQGESVFSPTSGFHHAGWDYGAAYCTFNGLMIAALSLHAKGLIGRVAILDMDQHFGDGTRDIIRRLGIDWVSHYTYGADPPTADTAEEWLASLGELVRRTVAGCGLVLYQAGVDPHVDDPLGGSLTTEQLSRRDRVVFEECRRAGVAVVTNLAGGYQKPVERVVQLHVETLKAFASTAA